MPGRFPIVSDVIAENKAMTIGGRTSFADAFSMGPGIYEIWLRVKIAVTIGTGAGPINQGELNFIKSLYMKTDLGEVPLDNVPGRGMYNVAITKAKTTPRKDAIAAASGTYIVDLPIYFADPLMVRPEDLILDTSRYKSINFDVTLGTIADLFTAPGTATVTATADLMVRRSKGRWNSEEAAPVGYVCYSVRNPVDAATVTEIKFELSTDLTYKRAYVHASTAGVAGQPWYGANSDAIIAAMTLKDGEGDWIRKVTSLQMQDVNKADYGLETVPAGLTVLDFVRDGSNKSAIYAGDKNELIFDWDNQSAPAANSIVTLLTEGYRALRLKAAA